MQACLGGGDVVRFRMYPRRPGRSLVRGLDEGPRRRGASARPRAAPGGRALGVRPGVVLRRSGCCTRPSPLGVSAVYVAFAAVRAGAGWLRRVGRFRWWTWAAIADRFPSWRCFVVPRPAFAGSLVQQVVCDGRVTWRRPPDRGRSLMPLLSGRCRPLARSPLNVVGWAFVHTATGYAVHRLLAGSAPAADGWLLRDPPIVSTGATPIAACTSSVGRTGCRRRARCSPAA